MGGSRPAGVRAGGWGAASGAPGPRSASVVPQAGQETSAGCPTAADAERIAGGGGVLIGRTSWWLESSADFSWLRRVPEWLTDAASSCGRVVRPANYSGDLSLIFPDPAQPTAGHAGDAVRQGLPVVWAGIRPVRRPGGRLGERRD